MEQVYFLFDKDENIVYSLGNKSEAKRNLPYVDYLAGYNEVILFGDKKNRDVYDKIMGEVGKSIVRINLDGDDGVIAKNDDSDNIIKTLEYINMPYAEFDEIYNTIEGVETVLFYTWIERSFSAYYKDMKEGKIK